MAELISIEQKVLDLLLCFTPLIQLWAAICLLFFYVDLLKESPLLSYINNLNDKFNKIVNKFQGYSFERASESDDDKKINYVSDNWGEFLPRVKNMAALSFFYCVFLLFIIGFGRYNYYKQDTPHIYIFSTSLFIIIYELCCYGINKKAFKLKRSPIICALIISMLYIFCFNKLEESFFNLSFVRNHFFAGGFVLFTCLLGLLLVLLYLAMVWWDLNKPKTKKLISLSNSLDGLYDAFFDENPWEKLSQEHKDSFLEKISDDLSKNTSDNINIKDRLRGFIREEVQREYDEIIGNIKK